MTKKKKYSGLTKPKKEKKKSSDNRARQGGKWYGVSKVGLTSL